MTDDREEIQNIEELADPIREDRVDPGFPWGGLIATLGMALVVIFAVQNTDSVEVRFLWIEGQSPLSLVILVTALASVVFTVLGGALYRRRRLRRRMEKEELRQLRSDS